MISRLYERFVIRSWGRQTTQSWHVSKHLFRQDLCGGFNRWAIRLWADWWAALAFCLGWLYARFDFEKGEEFLLKICFFLFFGQILLPEEPAQASSRDVDLNCDVFLQRSDLLPDVVMHASIISVLHWRQPSVLNLDQTRNLHHSDREYACSDYVTIGCEADCGHEVGNCAFIIVWSMTRLWPRPNLSPDKPTHFRGKKNCW